MSEWRLYVFDADFWKKKTPPAEPPGQAELSGDGAWATLYAADDRSILAVWIRPAPAEPQVDARAARAQARQRATLDADRTVG